MQLTRRKDWLIRMTDELILWQHRDFEPLENNCAFFLADVIRSMTDVDLAKRYRGRLKVSNSAKYRTKRFGAFVSRIVERTLVAAGGQVVSVTFARRGDLLTWNDPQTGLCSGICNGANGLYLSASGLIAIPRSSASRAITIG